VPSQPAHRINDDLGPDVLLSFHRKTEEPMQTMTCTRTTMPKDLEATIFADRGRQFVTRLNWNLCVTPEGLEYDEYDDDDSEYIAVHQSGRHLGSCRIRPVTNSTMLVDHFLSFFPEAKDFLKMQKGRVYELTRFCRAPDMHVSDSKVMLDSLAVALDSFRDERGLTGYIAVVFPQVARFLDSIGVRYLTLARSKMDGKPVQLICITHCVRVDRPQATVMSSNASKDRNAFSVFPRVAPSIESRPDMAADELKACAG
jgi:N-acyl-L-homoserine lactone synthetase